LPKAGSFVNRAASASSGNPVPKRGLYSSRW
jgi:hypothetical protein